MENHNYGVVLSSPTQETLPPYSTTWGQDTIEKGPEKRQQWHWWKVKYAWFVAQQRTAPTYEQVSEQANVAFNIAWNFLCRRGRPSTAQWIAFLLLLVFGILPMVMLAMFTRSGPNRPPFYAIFENKVLSCGSSFGTPENATVSGIQKVFVLDKTFGSFSFSVVKTIDVTWDILIGRGVQLIAWWIGYVVFSDALLRAIERHPASFQIFQRIALEGPSLLSLWTLLRELARSKSRRTKALFFYIWIATLYIISIPVFIGAMTGYDSTSIAWVSLSDSDNIVPAGDVINAGYVSGTRDKLFDQPACISYNDYGQAFAEISDRYYHCNCRLSNGTTLTPLQAGKYRVEISPYSYPTAYSWVQKCHFDFPDNNQTFERRGYSGKTEKCATSFNVTINKQQYDVLTLNMTYGLCYKTQAYDADYLRGRTRCLPDTANPSYQWGFSSIISGIFVFLHFGWSVTMYVIWQDAQFGSSLVKSGYQMTPLRAAFAMAKAARRKTGMSEKRLVRADTKEIEQELYGSGNKRGTMVGFELFGDKDDGEDGEGEGDVRRRSVRPKAGAVETEMEVSSAGLSRSAALP